MPHRYIDTATVEFTDGTTRKVVGNRERIHEGVLIISTASDYGPSRDIHRFPLSSIRYWTWEKE